VAPSTNDFFFNPLNLKGSAVIVALVPLVSLFISCFILMSGYGLIGILLPVRMDLESIPTDTIGLVLAMYAVGMLFGGMYCRKLIARAGYIRVLAAGAALSSTAILICSLTMNVWVWGAMRGLMGFCIACVYAVRQFCAISGMVVFIGVCGVISVVFPYQLTAHGIYLAKLEMDAIHALYTKFDEVHLTLNRVKYENDQLVQEVARLKNAEQLRLERDAEIRSEPNDPDDWSTYF
jgi:hypothetical protein